jgi:hypothetical protein
MKAGRSHVAGPLVVGAEASWAFPMRQGLEFPSKTRPSLANLLALNRTVAVVLLAVLFFGQGEQLWEPYMPVYLKARSKDAVRATPRYAICRLQRLMVLLEKPEDGTEQHILTDGKTGSRITGWSSHP